MLRRRTPQRELVLQTVRDLACHAPAEAIYQKLKIDHPRLGRGTVYRNLNILAEEGAVQKLQLPGGAECFDHITEKHAHLRCRVCGGVFDVETESLPEILSMAKGAPGMQIEDFALIFTGLCPDCAADLSENSHTAD